MIVRPAKTQISLGIRPVWSESSLCTQWVAKGPSYLHADSENSDQTGQMPRLIWVFARRTCHFVGFVIRRLKWYLISKGAIPFKQLRLCLEPTVCVTFGIILILMSSTHKIVIKKKNTCLNSHLIERLKHRVRLIIIWQPFRTPSWVSKISECEANGFTI